MLLGSTFFHITDIALLQSMLELVVPQLVEVYMLQTTRALFTFVLVPS